MWSNRPAQRLPSARQTLAISSVARFSVPLTIRNTRSAPQRRTSSATASAAGRPNVTASMLPKAIRPACGMAHPPVVVTSQQQLGVEGGAVFGCSEFRGPPAEIIF